MAITQVTNLVTTVTSGSGASASQEGHRGKGVDKNERRIMRYSEIGLKKKKNHNLYFQTCVFWNGARER
jgi:hypothetical protein